MRTLILIGLFASAIAACGEDSGTTPDGPSGNHPPPRVIPGGGIGDGAIDGVVNVYVIDDATRLAISGATVRVGTVEGTTGADGLFVADGVVGAQTVAVKAASYRSELWLGANGANMTFDLHAATDPVTKQANLTGSITGFSAITVASGHHKAAMVSYSQSDKASDAENNLTTAASANICDTGVAAGTCSFTVTTRTGDVAVIAVILDHDLKGTPSDATDDTYTVIGWAAKIQIQVASGVAQTGVDLAMVDVANLANATADFGSPPSAMPNVAAIVGIETPTSGVMQLFPEILTPSAPSVLAPKLAAFPGATYRLTALANNGTTETAAQSFVLRRGLTASPLAAGSWLDPPSGLSLTRTGGSWTHVAGALVQGAEYNTDATHHLLNATVFDASTSFIIPDLVALPATGTLMAKGTALAGTLDLTSFAIDDDLAKVTASANQPIQID